MSNFLTFTLINLKHQLLALELEAEVYPEKREQLQQVREAMARALKKTTALQALEAAKNPLNSEKH